MRSPSSIQPAISLDCSPMLEPTWPSVIWVRSGCLNAAKQRTILGKVAGGIPPGGAQSCQRGTWKVGRH